MWKINSAADPTENQHPNLLIWTLSCFLLIVLLCLSIRLIHWLQEDSTSSCPLSLNCTKTQTKQVTGVLWMLEHWGMNKIHWHKQCTLFSPQFSKISIFRQKQDTFPTTYAALQCGFGSWSFFFFFFTYFCPKSPLVLIWFPLWCVVLTISTASSSSNKTPCIPIELGWWHSFHTWYLCTCNQSNLRGELTI